MEEREATIRTFLEDLAGRGVEISVDGELLGVRAPRGVLADRDRALLAKHKEEILSVLRGDDPLAADETFPLTDIQQAYWVGRREGLGLGGVGCHAYREIHAVHIDLVRLEAAWQKLIERHEMLRAVVTPEGRQRILPEAVWRLPVLDLRGRPDAAAVGRELGERMSHHVFDPERWPLFDIRAVRRDDGVRVHIGLDLLIADAASTLLLFQEWGELYRDLDARLPPLERSFRRHVLDGERSRNSDEVRAARQYWLARLEALPGPPVLPLARDPSRLERPRFVRRTHRIEAGSWGRLRHAAATRGLTPSGVLLAAYADVLAAWSREQRFLVTMTLFRAPHGMEGVVGDFTTTILLEARCDEATFEARALRIRDQLADDMAHSAVSGVEVLREMTRVRHAPVNAIPYVFTSAIGHRTLTSGGRPPTEWIGETTHAITQTPQVFLDSHVVEDGDALLASWDAVEALFPPGLLDDMFGEYALLLEGLARGPEAWRSSIGDRFPAGQRSRRARVNATARPVAEEWLQTPFERQAHDAPDRIAVVDRAGRWTYGRIDALAIDLALRLRARGAGPGTLVGVALERGHEQAVAALGVLKAGAAYLPIDPALPAARRDYLVENGALSLVVTGAGPGESWLRPEQRIAAVLPGGTPEGRDFPCPARPSDLAYVIYTSGSTGRPKGVMIEHRSALNTVLDVNRRFGIGAGDRVLGLSSLSFDLSVYDLFGALAAGGAVVYPAPDRRKDPGHWTELIREEEVTVWNSVPTLMRMLVEHLSSAERRDPPLASLRRVFLSGDWVPLDLPGRVRALAPRACVVALGGATEASIWSNYYEVGEIEESWRSIPYGWPLANQRFRVVDASGLDCPDWVPGQLVIEGLGVARGYWRDPEKTRASFSVDPGSGEPTYATGDLGRYLPDGKIEFLGRRDTQVKIRGHRVELGEIESVLSAHPRVAEAAVAAFGQDSDSRKLVAYVVPRSGPAGEVFLLDPALRLQFRMESRSVRREPGRARLPLAGAGPGEALLDARRTHRRYGKRPVPRAAFDAFLSSLSATDSPDGLTRRHRYPSAGSLYPVQTYLHVVPGKVEGLPGGTYYHHPVENSLIELDPAARLERSLHVPENRPFFDSAAFSIFLVADYAAIRPLYGDLSRDFCLIEAGAIGQLLQTVGVARGIGLCAIGVIDAGMLAPILALSSDHEVLTSFVGGALPDSTLKPAKAAPMLPARSDLEDELSRYLEQRLPDVMRPSAWVVMERLPRNAHGKLDRAALPPPVPREPARPREAVAGGLERSIAGVVARTLSLSDVGRADNFFELGATSLDLVRIHRRLRDELGLDVEIVDLLGHPTVADLAESLGASADVNQSSREGRARGEARRAARGGGDGSA